MSCRCWHNQEAITILVGSDSSGATSRASYRSSSYSNGAIGNEALNQHSVCRHSRPSLKITSSKSRAAGCSGMSELSTVRQNHQRPKRQTVYPGRLCSLFVSIVSVDYIWKTHLTSSFSLISVFIENCPSPKLFFVYRV